MNELWETLGFSELRRVFRRTRHAIDVEALIRVMVFNRLCDPESKLDVLRWLETVAMPGIDVESITLQHLLRSMNALIDPELSVVFSGMTMIRAEGLSAQDGDVRKFGMAKKV